MRFDNLDDIKIGDYVTQNDNFYESWNSKKVSLKVINKDNSGNILLERKVYFINKDNIPNKQMRKTNTFWEGYFKIDLSKLRKLKLKKLNESNL